MADEELIALSREAESAEERSGAVNELFQRYASRVALWCYRVTGDRNSAADLAQEALLRAFENLHTFQGKSKFSTWLYSVTRNHCLNFRQAQASRREESIEPHTFEVASAYTESFEMELDRTNSIKLLRTLAAEKLEQTERAVMALHYGEECKLDAITRLLGLTNPSGAKAYIVSARRKLSAALRDQARRK